MSIKYSLKDVLLEAGVSDYKLIETDDTWMPSPSHKKIMEKIYKKEKSANNASIVIKVMYAAAAAALIFGLSLTIKPVRDAVSAVFGISPKTPVVTETEALTEKPPVTDTDAESETETEAETKPPTEEDEMAAVIDDIINNGCTEEKWRSLRSYSVNAFIYCFDSYFNTECDNMHKMIYSVLCSQYLAPELKRYAPDFNFRSFNLELSEDDIKPSSAASYGMWLKRFRAEIEEYMTCYRRQSEEYENLYFTDLFLDRLDYIYYRAGSPDTPPEEYKPNRCVLNENIEYLKVHGIKSYNHRFQTAFFNTENCIEKLLDMYGREQDVKRRAAISTVIALLIQVFDSEDATQGGRMTQSDFYGDGYAYLTSINMEEIKKLDVNADVSYYAEWLDGFFPILEKAASGVPEITVMQDREVCYRILKHRGFDNYYVMSDTEKKITTVLNEFFTLYNGTLTGAVDADVYYSNYPQDNPLPLALIEKIRTFVPDYDNPSYEFRYSTPAAELSTSDGWHNKMYSLLEDKNLADVILANENENYLTVDGIVYCITAPKEGGYFTYTSIMPGSVKTVSEKDDIIIVTADVRWSKSRSEIHTFYLRKTDGGFKIINDGSFFEKYIH